MKTKTKTKTVWIIKDWADNHCFPQMAFETYEDAWGFLYEKFLEGDEDHTFEEYFVTPKEENDR